MWVFNNNNIEDINQLPQNAYGFIYIITHIPTGRKYIGKKCLHNYTNKRLGKKEIAQQMGRGRKAKTKPLKKESDWKTYYGSTSYIKDLISENKQTELSREIIEIAYSKKQLTYLEIKLQFVNGVLENPDIWINDNIGGRYFRKDI